MKWLNARFFTISATTEYFDKNNEIKGKLIVEEKKSLEGMSGGVFYCMPNSLTRESLNNNFDISKDYYFVGIGLRYDKKGNLISGLSRNKIISLINSDFFTI